MLDGDLREAVHLPLSPVQGTTRAGWAAVGGLPLYPPSVTSCQATLEKCSACSEPILDRILRAMGKAYHPGCFTCVECRRSLDGIPFTVDATSQIHCIEDFHRLPWLCLSCFQLLVLSFL